MAKNVKLEEALDIVESKLVVKEVLKDLIKEAVEKQNRPKLKPITLKLNNLTSFQKPTLINIIKKKPKSNFKVIRVSPSLKKVTKRPGSGLDISDYKGKKRKNRRPKKLGKNHALKKYDQFALNTSLSFFWGSTCVISRKNLLQK